MLSNFSISRNYLALLENLPISIKQEIIDSLELTNKPTVSNIEKYFGAWKSDESADELIANIRNNRVFNRVNEEL